MTAQLIPQHVPTQTQFLASIQVIIDNRRHAQNVIRWNKFRAFMFISIALLATIAASVHTKTPAGNDTVSLGLFFAAKILPGLILLAAPFALWSHVSSYPGCDSRSSSWQLGLGQADTASLMSLITMENKALKAELFQADFSSLVCSCTCILCTCQFVAAGLMILHR